MNQIIRPYTIEVELRTDDKRKEGSIHISQIADRFIRNISDEVQLGEILQAKIINDYNTKVADVRFIKSKLMMRHRLNAYNASSPYSVSSSSTSAFSQSSKDFLEIRTMLPIRIVFNNPELASL